MSSPSHTGGCACAAIRFETSGPPQWVAHCHCGDCRRTTASPFTTYAGFAESDVRFVEGEPRRFASSEGVVRSFCADCGTSVSFAGDRWPGELHLFACTFDDPAAVEPQVHVYTSEQLPWVHLADELPRRSKVSE